MIDSSMIKCFMSCKEKLRRQYVENIVPKKPRIHLEYGTAIHLSHEAFWSGEPYEIAFGMAARHCDSIDLSGLKVKEVSRWDDMVKYMPDLIAEYYDNQEYEPQEMVEEEWDCCFNCGHALGHHRHAENTEGEFIVCWFYNCSCNFPQDSSKVFLCGKIDRYHNGRLYDLKTASEIGGKEWKSRFKAEKLRDPGLALYDWYLRKIGKPVEYIAMEVLIKPYRGKPARYELIELNEIMAYRERFENQLNLILKQMVQYLDKYSTIAPWDMSFTECVSKYGECDYLPLCNGGDSNRNLDRYTTRQEHLEVRKC